MEVEADSRVPACDARGLSDAACTLRRALASARLFRELHETSHRLILGEYLDVSSDRGNALLEGCGEITQLCWDAQSGQVAICDTDFLAVNVGAHPLSFPSSVSDRLWGRNSGGSGRGDGHASKASRESAMLDMPCAFARSVLTQWLGVLPWLQPLIEEVEARHGMINAGVEVVQMSFSCIEAWMAAAADVQRGQRAIK